jgi:4-hydroxy-tetrahydrodipicolinate synthase
MFSGSIVALVTPFRDGRVDRDALVELVDYHIDSGTHGIVPCGTTGESATLSHEEHDLVVSTVVERAKGKIPVLAGTGSNNTTESIRMTRFAQEVGADAALIISPYYNKPTQAGLVAHFEAIAQATDIPLVLYNVPPRTSSNMLPATVIECAKLPRVVAIKEASGSIDQSVEILRGSDLAVLSGDDSLTLPLMAVGAKGVISVAANVAPKLTAQMVEHALRGDFESARQLHLRLYPLFDALFIESNPIPVKRVLELQGRIQPEIRLPLLPLTEASQAVLSKVLEEVRPE